MKAKKSKWEFDYDLSFSSSIMDVTGPSHLLENSTPNDCGYEILQVPENLRNKPVFG